MYSRCDYITVLNALASNFGHPQAHSPFAADKLGAADEAVSDAIHGKLCQRRDIRSADRRMAATVQAMLS